MASRQRRTRHPADYVLAPSITPDRPGFDGIGRLAYNAVGTMPLDYEQSGVKYHQLDAFKRACQLHAAQTVSALAAHGMGEPPGVRGDSAYLIETDGSYLAHVEEGLGTKNLVADAVAQATGRCFYRAIGIDTVATIVNDLITCGALPISVAMHAAVGDSGWFADHHRAEQLAIGFAEGCRLAGAVWGGGETPALPGIVEPHTIVLAGSAIGQIRPKSHRITPRVAAGDRIIFVPSSGVQTNGLTLCRTLAARLPDGYAARLTDGRTFGEALLEPSVIYVKLIAAMQSAGIMPSYAVHVTGHGWRKLMRAHEPMVYRITEVRETPELFKFIARHGPVTEREMFATFNMGVGFAVYVPPPHAEAAVQVARRCGYDAWIAGELVRDGNRKAVEIAPAGITFDADTLQVR
jgi:phosphoribosylformylglycinamidine cyclo-ligase